MKSVIERFNTSKGEDQQLGNPQAEVKVHDLKISGRGFP